MSHQKERCDNNGSKSFAWRPISASNDLQIALYDKIREQFVGLAVYSLGKYLGFKNGPTDPFKWKITVDGPKIKIFFRVLMNILIF